MASIDFSELFDTLKTGVVDLAKGTVSNYLSQATQEGQNALDEMKTDLEAWAKAIATGDMGIEDLKFLIAGRKEITEMKGLEQLGIAQIQLDKFKNGIVDLIVNRISVML